MINTIIFGLGGVVVFQPRDLWRSIFLDLSNISKIDFKTFESHMEKYKSDIQVGKMRLYDFYRNVLNSVQRSDIKPEELLRIHLDLFTKYSGKYDKDMLKLINLLRKKYRVVCLTNTEPEIVELSGRNGLFDYFEKAFISSEMGLKKPDIKSYEKVSDELRIEPRQAVLIDNIPNYVEAAKKIGINGILYQDIDHLKQELASLSVDID